MTTEDRARAARATQITRALAARQEGAAIFEGLRDAFTDHVAARSQSSAYGPFVRSAEHLVLAPGTGAATPNAVFPLTASWSLELADVWTAAATPIAAATSIVQITEATGLPLVPRVETPPTAGSQNGQKTEAYSKAFKLSAASTAEIDSTLYLNFSAQLEAFAPAGVELANAMMRTAVAAEADRQIGAAIVARGTAAADMDAGFGVFDTGRFLPAVMLVPPGRVGDVDVPSPTDLVALGVRPVLAHVTKPVLLAAGAVTGFLLPLALTAPEPSVLGRQTAYAMWGQVAVDPAGVAVLA